MKNNFFFIKKKMSDEDFFLNMSFEKMHDLVKSLEDDDKSQTSYGTADVSTMEPINTMWNNLIDIIDSRNAHIIKTESDDKKIWRIVSIKDNYGWKHVSCVFGDITKIKNRYIFKHLLFEKGLSNEEFYEWVDI